jgi:hypothetical protein
MLGAFQRKAAAARIANPQRMRRLKAEHATKIDLFKSLDPVESFLPARHEQPGGLRARFWHEAAEPFWPLAAIMVCDRGARRHASDTNRDRGLGLPCALAPCCGQVRDLRVVRSAAVV